MTPELEPVMRAVLYPAQVSLPTGEVLRRVKLVLTEARAYVFTAPDVLAYEAPYSTAEVPSPLAPRSEPWVVATDDGELTAKRMSGCGCGVALKRWLPFAPERWSVTV